MAWHHQGAIDNHHVYYRYPQEYERQEVRRVPSPESVSSVQCSSFNFDDLKSNIEEVSKEGMSEPRQPVQHPAGNESNSSEQADVDEITQPSSSYSITNDIRTFHQTPHSPDEESVYNSISFSEFGSMAESTINQHRPIRPNQVQYQPFQYGITPRHMISSVPGPSCRPPHFSPMSQPCAVFPPAAHFSIQQQRFHLRNGYSNSPSSIGFRESLTNISAPEPIEPPEYKRETSKESSVDTSNFFVTMNPPDIYEQQVPQVKTISNGIYENTTQPYPTPAPAPTPAQPARPIKEKVKVFVTYATEAQNPDHIRTVVQISQTLFKNSIEVTVDVLEETFKAVSISDWLESNITNSHFVLICISPNYRQVVDGQALADGAQNENAVNTQYIYRRIHAEYIGQGSKNYRFIPVLVSGAQVQHIPAWLRDTKVFEWPKDYEDIIYRLFKQERFVRPTPGKAPEHTIQRYNERSSSFENRKTTQSQKMDKSGQSTSKR